MIAFLIAAVSLGFFSSFHCIGMCGPIAMALPVHGYAPAKKWMLLLIYNFGRLLTYSILGYVFGTIGWSISIAGYQQALSVALGVSMFALLLFPLNRFLSGKVNFLTGLTFKIKNAYKRLFMSKSKTSFFLIGMLNGFLPCGLVYVAIAAAIATAGSLSGAAFMFMFGLGTAPALLSLTLFSNSISQRIRNKITNVAPVVMALTAILLIFRGLNLGIPYLSPKLGERVENVKCHTTNKSKVILCPVNTELTETTNAK